MKKIWKLILLVMLISSSSFSQFNLVPNPSFEVFDTCPDWVGQIRYASPWFSPQIGYTPDYFNPCDTINQYGSAPENYIGFQYAHSGVAYADIVTAWFPSNPAAWNYREYIEVELTDALISGKDYCIRWYVSACDSCWYISNNIGIFFSDTAVSYPCPGCPSPLSFTPQFENPINHDLNDRFGWTEISGTYTAMGGEKFILIGNFHDTASTVAINTGWSNPMSTAYNSAVYYIDDILVTPCDSLAGIEENPISNLITISPNPFRDQLIIESKGLPIQEIFIFDIVGHIIFNEMNIRKNHKEIGLSNLCNGIYVLRVRINGTESNFKLIKN